MSSKITTPLIASPSSFLYSQPARIAKSSIKSSIVSKSSWLTWTMLKTRLNGMGPTWRPFSSPLDLRDSVVVFMKYSSLGTMVPLFPVLAELEAICLGKQPAVTHIRLTTGMARAVLSVYPIPLLEKTGGVTRAIVRPPYHTWTRESWTQRVSIISGLSGDSQSVLGISIGGEWLNYKHLSGTALACLTPFSIGGVGMKGVALTRFAQTVDITNLALPVTLEALFIEFRAAMIALSASIK